MGGAESGDEGGSRKLELWLMGIKLGMMRFYQPKE